MNLCPVANDINRMYDRADMAEQKYKRIRAWLISSGRVEDAIVKAMREDGDFDDFVRQHMDGWAVIQLGLIAIHPRVCRVMFDDEYLKTLASRVTDDFIKQEFDATLDLLIDAEWQNWSDE